MCGYQYLNINISKLFLFTPLTNKKNLFLLPILKYEFEKKKKGCFWKEKKYI